MNNELDNLEEETLAQSRCYREICLQGLRKVAQRPRQDSRRPGRGLSRHSHRELALLISEFFVSFQIFLRKKISDSAVLLADPNGMNKMSINPIVQSRTRLILVSHAQTSYTWQCAGYSFWKRLVRTRILFINL
jgi:hypothetical protein